MLSGIKDSRYFIITVVAIWAAAFLIVGWKLPGSGDTKLHLWNPSAGLEIVSGRPVPMLSSQVSGDDEHMPLAMPVRAQRISHEGGTVSCERYDLRVPPYAVLSSSYVSLKSVSPSALAVDFETSYGGIDLPVNLMISYRGTQYGPDGLDASKLEVFREITLGVYERVPSTVDSDAQCVIAQVSLPGRYIVA